MSKKFANPVSEQVYHYLIDMILSLQIKPGDRIPEAVIAQRFNISRTPIREALKELAKDGIINVYPNRFSEVAIYDENYIRELGMTKIYIDRMAVKLASYYGSRAEYERLRNLAEKCYEAARGGDVLNRIKSDSDFHGELVLVGKNRPLMELSNRLIIQIEYLQAANYLAAEESEAQYRSHIAVVDALREGQLERALEAITEHSIEFYRLKNIPPMLYL